MQVIFMADGKKKKTVYGMYGKKMALKNQSTIYSQVTKRTEAGPVNKAS